MKVIVGIMTALTMMSAPAFARSAPVHRTAKSVAVKKGSATPKTLLQKKVRRTSHKKKDVTPTA